MKNTPTKDTKSTPRKRQPQPQVEDYPHTSLGVIISEESLGVFGLLPGDTITAIPCPDPQPGDLVIMLKRGDSEVWNCGRFIGYEDCKTGRKYVIEWTDGDDYVFRVAEYYAYKVTTIQRPVKHGEASESETERELKRLRSRLEKINADDITNSTAILKLEKQIFDLEHPVDLNDWSAWEEKEGAR